MNIVYIIIIIISTFAGIILAVAGFAGSFVVAGGILVCSLIDRFETVGYLPVIVFFILAGAGEIMEYVSGIWGAKRYGSSNKGIVGAIIGGLTGAVVFSGILIGIGTVIGVLLGTFLGAFIGEYISGKDIVSSGRAGWGAFLGRVAAIGFKVVIILIMAVIALLRYI